MTTMTCAHTNTTLAKQRGTRQRLRCTDCLAVLPWQKIGAQAPAQQQTAQTTPNTPQPVQQGETQPLAWLSDLTVGDLRALAKDKGHTGYSSMKKADLIDMLRGDA